MTNSNPFFEQRCREILIEQYGIPDAMTLCQDRLLQFIRVALNETIEGGEV